MAGSRTTEACEPRQVRKEAAAANTTMCCGKPGHQKYIKLMHRCMSLIILFSRQGRWAGWGKNAAKTPHLNPSTLKGTRPKGWGNYFGEHNWNI